MGLPLQLTTVFPDAHNPRVTPRFAELKNEYDEQILTLAMDGRLEELYAEHFTGTASAATTADDEQPLHMMTLVPLLAYAGLFAVLTFKHFLKDRAYRKAHPEIENHSIWKSTMGYVARHFDIAWSAHSAKVAAFEKEHKGVLNKAFESKDQKNRRRMSQIDDQLEEHIMVGGQGTSTEGGG